MQRAPCGRIATHVSAAGVANIWQWKWRPYGSQTWFPPVFSPKQSANISIKAVVWRITHLQHWERRYDQSGMVAEMNILKYMYVIYPGSGHVNYKLLRVSSVWGQTPSIVNSSNVEPPA
jgi:hypothetical protein